MRFRIWSPEDGRYTSSEVVQYVIREHLVRALGGVEEADRIVRRALAGGTSEEGKRRDTDADWDKEKDAAPAATASTEAGG
ncbi:MAG: hypothetical protein U0166_23035 [Acidobacteriota bacterium]